MHLFMESMLKLQSADSDSISGAFVDTYVKEICFNPNFNMPPQVDQLYFSEYPLVCIINIEYMTEKYFKFLTKTFTKSVYGIYS